ncbi:MAG: lipopolysaccharide biosynthesis protein [Aphanocapsa lilacina HA4352-LM1]|jgi:PST family polysaccharide transporter|nr:lipopolysaccharide biosynthesis protein [Aphanocapsa lilacina HA4352-LM1]
MNLRQKAVKGVGWSAIRNLGSQGISLGVYFVLARLLGPEAFGLVALAAIFVSFVQIFLEQGLPQAIVQRSQLEKAHLDTAFWANLAVGTLLTALCFASSGPVANFFHEPRVGPVVCWLSFSLFIGSFNAVQQGILTREFAFKSLAVRSLIATAVGGIVGIAMALSGCGVWSLVGQQLVSQLIGVVTLWQVSSWRPGFAVSLRHLGELLSFGVNVTAFNLSNFFNRRADSFLIGYFLGPVALGYYTIAYNILLAMTQLLTATTTQVALPTFSRLQHAPERLLSAFYTVTQFTSLISFPAFLGVAVLAPELVAVLFGEQWTASVPVMQVLSLVGIQQSVFFFNGTVLMAMGKPSWRLWLNVLNSIVGVVTFAIAVPWGIVAVAAAYVVRVYLLSPVALWAVNRLMPIDLGKYLRQFAPALVSSLGVVCTIWAVRVVFGSVLSPLALLTLASVVGAAVYALALRLSAPELFARALDYARLLVPLGAGSRAPS